MAWIGSGSGVKNINVNDMDKPDYIPQKQNTGVQYDTGVRVRRSEPALSFKAWLFFVIMSIAVMGFIYLFLRHQYEQSYAFRTALDGGVTALFYAVLAAAVVALALALLGLWNKMHALGFIRGPGDVPMHQEDWRNGGTLLGAHLMNQHFAVQGRLADNSLYRNVTQWSPSHSAPEQQKALLEAADDGDDAAPLIPADEWLPWLDEKPHFLLAAETGGGKSVAASVVMARRVQQRGDAIAILDPHWSPMVEADEGQLVPKWGGIQPAARSHDEIRAALKALRAEYDQRKDQLRTGAVIERHFPPLTVIIDEVPEVVAELHKRDRRGEDTWADTTEVLGSGARKVNISIILLTQSPLVQDIDLNTAMRKNFMRVALQHAEIVSLVREASDAENKAAVLAAVKGQRFPAALLRDGAAYALDRSDLLTRMPRAITATPWVPPTQATTVPAVATDIEQRDALARAMFARGAKFRPVADVLRKRGYAIDNNRLSELYREVNGA